MFLEVGIPPHRWEGHPYLLVWGPGSLGALVVTSVLHGDKAAGTTPGVHVPSRQNIWGRIPKPELYEPGPTRRVLSVVVTFWGLR